MITKTENENLFILIAKYGDSRVSGDKLAINHYGQKLADYIDSLTEKTEVKTEVKPKVYYAVNFNPIGYLPESEPYEGLENVDEIMYAIDDICYRFEDSEGIDPNLELPEKRHIREMLTELIEQDKLEHETIGYIGNYAIFVYKDEEYEYRQSK